MDGDALLGFRAWPVGQGRLTSAHTTFEWAPGVNRAHCRRRRLVHATFLPSTPARRAHRVRHAAERSGPETSRDYNAIARDYDVPLVPFEMLQLEGARHAAPAPPEFMVPVQWAEPRLTGLQHDLQALSSAMAGLGAAMQASLVEVAKAFAERDRGALESLQEASPAPPIGRSGACALRRLRDRRPSRVDGYTRGEVAWLLGLTREEAIVYDAGRTVDRTATLTENAEAGTKLAPSSGAEEWDPVFTIARWHDVHAARSRIVARRMLEDGVERREILLELVIVRLRSWGIAEPTVAEMVGIERLAARRRFKGVLDDILAELGEKDRDALMLERPPDACMKCAERPRIRSARKVRVVRDGQRKTEWEERQTSLCAVCIEDVKLRRREVRGTMRELREVA